MADLKQAIHAAVAGAIMSAATPVVLAPGRNLDTAASMVATKIVTLPEIQHVTNTEVHWYQKRSFWSAIVSGLLVVAGPLLTKYGLSVNPATTDLIATSLTTLGGLWAAYLAVRAGTATKPLGT